MRRRTQRLSILATAMVVALSLLLVQAVAADNGPCNPPMDVVFVIDDTGSMGGAIGNVKSELAGILNLIDEKSAGNYQLGLVTFKDNPGVAEPVALAAGNRVAVEAAINGLTATAGGKTPEASNTAVYDVVNEAGVFSGSWRDEAIKVVILVTDAPPGGAATDDVYDDPDDPDLAHQAADDAAAADILIGSVLVGYNSTALPIMQYYASATGGQFVQTPSDGTGTGDAFIQILETLETDLEIEKWADSHGIAGEELLYNIGVHNNGPGDAQNVVVVDTLPLEGVTFLGSDAGCTSNGAVPEVITCELDRLACGDYWQFELKTSVDAGLVRLDGDGVVEVENTAVVSADNPETYELDNTITAHTIVQEEADLMVTKVSKPDHTVPAGEPFFYTIYVDNLGPSWARGVFINDDMVASDEFTVVQIIDDPARNDDCTQVPATSPQTGTIIKCELWEPLEPWGVGQGPGRWRIQIEVTADETQDVDNLVRVYAGPNVVPDVIEYESGTPDPDMSNNEALDFISVLDVADLELSKRADLEIVTAGNLLRYTLRVTNTGPSAAFNVVYADNLPAETEIVGVIVGDGDCVAGTPGDPADPTTCVIDELDWGEIAAIYITVRVAPDVPVNPVLPCDQPAPFCRSRIFNDAWVVADTPDPDMSNNLETEDVDVKYSADLEVFKGDLPDIVAAGQEVTYEVIVNNSGPSMARDVVVVDTLPPEVEFLSATILDDQMGALDCALIAGNKVACELGDLPPGDPPLGQVHIYITVRVKPDTPPGTIQNSVTVSTFATSDPEPDNNTTTEDTGVTAAAQLAIEKTSEPQKVYAGEQKKYTIKVTNEGPSTARGVTVIDTLPAGVTYETDTGGCQGSPLVCVLGTDLAPGDTWEFSIWVLVDAGVAPGTELVNEACVQEDPPLGGGEPVCDTAENLVLGKADLRVFKDCKPDDLIVEGETAICTISVQNLGPSVATEVTFRDDYLSDGQFHFGTLPGAPADCISSDIPLDYVWCKLLAPLPVGLTWITHIPVIGDEPQNINDHVTASSAAEDPDESNNWAEDEVNVGPQADLSVSKTMTGEVQIALEQGLVFDITDPNQPFPAAPNYATSATDVTAGRRIQYEVNVRNGGPTPAENVVLSDRLPAGVTIYPSSLEISQGSCQTGTPGEPLDRMTCGLGSILSGEGVTLTLEVLVDPSLTAGTVLENDVSVTSDTYDHDNSNNQANTQTVVQTWADMTITKLSVGERVDSYDHDLDRHVIEQVPGEVTAGMELRYEISVQNNGASDAQNVQVLDLLPGQSDTGLPSDPVTFVRSDGVDCQPLDEQQEFGVFGPVVGQGKFGQILWCDLGTVAAGARETFHIYVHVDPAVPATTVLTNGAYVSWGAASPPAQPGLFNPFPLPQIPPELPTTDDPYLDNNFAATDTTVDVFAELAIEKTSEPQKVYAGEQKIYTIKVTNLGPSVARGVAVIDTLPVGVAYETDNAGCVEGPPGTLDCTPGDMMPGEMWEASIWAVVDPGIEPGTTLVNEACVGDELVPPRPVTGNCASAENLVLGKADLRITKFGKPDAEVRTGEVLTYTVVVDNLGLGNAWGVALKDILQTNGTFDLIDIVSDRDATCTLLLPGDVVQGPFPLTADPWPPNAPVPPAPGVNQPTGEGGIQERLQVDCTLDEDLGVLAADGPPNSGRWILTVRVRAFQSQSMNNVADVVADTLDPDTDNNHAEVLHDITEAVDLKVTKSAVGKVVEPGGAVSEKADEVTAGLSMTYTIEVENLGPMRAENVRLEDLLPVEVVVTGWKVDQGWCLERDPDNLTEPMTCELGELAAGQTVTVEIYVEVPAPVPCDSWLANSVRVYSDFFDPDEQNNVSDNLTQVNAMADLGVSKVQSPDIVLGGKPIEYRIDVWNQGPSDAPGVVIEDLFPEELMILSWECVPVGTGATCPEYDPDVRDLEYSFNLPAGTYVYFIVHGMRLPYPDWSFTNEVQVSTGGCVQDPILSDNTASDVNEPYMHFLPVIGHIRFQWSLPDLKVKALWAEPLGLTVRIVNSGPETVTGPFWVDAYIDPVSAPTAVGQQWIDLAEQGAVWYVQGDALPLEPGATLDLHNDDEYYVPAWSEIEWPISPGRKVYAQVDSRSGAHGMVYEKHEAQNALYNNIGGPVTSIR